MWQIFLSSSAHKNELNRTKIDDLVTKTKFGDRKNLDSSSAVTFSEIGKNLSKMVRRVHFFISPAKAKEEPAHRKRAQLDQNWWYGDRIKQSSSISRWGAWRRADVCTTVPIYCESIKKKPKETEGVIWVGERIKTLNQKAAVQMTRAMTRPAPSTLQWYQRGGSERKLKRSRRLF